MGFKGLRKLFDIYVQKHIEYNNRSYHTSTNINLNESKLYMNIHNCNDHANIKNDEYYESDMCYGQYHFELFDASRDGNYDEFMKYVKFGTKLDFDWATEVCSDIRILKYLLEEKKVIGWHKHCYKNAVLYNNIEICNYIEKREGKNWAMLQLAEGVKDVLPTIYLYVNKAKKKRLGIYGKRELKKYKREMRKLLERLYYLSPDKETIVKLFEFTS